MQPWVIRQGDYLEKLAYTFGFDADAVWNSEANAQLRALRSDPNILCTTDILYIPEPPPPKGSSLVVGDTNTFTSDPPTVPIQLHLADDRLGSQSCTIDELDHLTDLATDETGLLKFDAPVTLGQATIRFASIGLTCNCRIGYLDPIETMSGVIQRLQGLGYLAVDQDYDSTGLDDVRDALRALRAAEGAHALAIPELAEELSSDSPCSVTIDIAPGAYQCERGAAGTTDEAAATTDKTATTTEDGASPNAPDSTPEPASTPDAGATPDPAGLSDDGTLDDSTYALLRSAYGC